MILYLMLDDEAPGLWEDRGAAPHPPATSLAAADAIAGYE
jgi:hypothetical protein